MLAYLLPGSQSIVTIVYPGPIFFASLIAPAILIPEDPPSTIFCFSIKSYTIFKASESSVWKASSIIAFSKSLVILAVPIPSVI